MSTDGAITEHTRRAYNCLLGSRDPYIENAVCVPCSMKDPIGITVASGTLETLPVPMSLQDLTRARAALETIRSITDSLVTLGVLDAPAEAPILDEEVRRVDGGILDQYEVALQSEREDERVAHMAANDMRRVFLSDREIQNTGTDQETWEIAVVRASQLRKMLNDSHPVTDLMDNGAALKLARDQALFLAATWCAEDHGYSDEQELILSAIAAAKRGWTPWKLGERVTNAEKAEKELRIDLGNVKEERDAAIRAWNEQTVKAAGLSDANEHARRVVDEQQTTIEELKASRDRWKASTDELEQQLEAMTRSASEWKERAEAAERGQPGRFSNPTPPADGIAVGGAVVASGGWCCPADQVPPELLECTGGSECPAAVHATGCYSETWTRAVSKDEGTDE